MSNANSECQHWINNTTGEHQIVNAAVAGRSYTRFRTDPASVIEYWDTASDHLRRQGLTFADVDVVYNKNITTCGTRDITHYRCDAPESVLYGELVDGMIAFQAEAEARMPQAAGVHGIRSDGTWCTKSPSVIANMHHSAILDAITYSSKWSVGPDLSAPDYVRDDFDNGGCHPALQGLDKMLPILDEFFSGIAPPPPPPSECR